MFYPDRMPLVYADGTKREVVLQKICDSPLNYGMLCTDCGERITLRVGFWQFSFDQGFTVDKPVTCPGCHSVICIKQGTVVKQVSCPA